EEEHAGGALVYPSYDLGEEFSGDLHVRNLGYSFDQMIAMFGDLMNVQPSGYAIDKKYPQIIYVPEDAHFDLRKQTVSWSCHGRAESIRLSPSRSYVRPSGYKLRLEKPPGDNRAWRLVGSVAEGVFCHKPSTV